ncbi:hypothetical protein IWW38_005198, partial [Coemansia aciculifera]
LKRPYGDNVLPARAAADSVRWVKDTAMYTETHGKKLFAQLLSYMKAGSNDAPIAVEGTINPDFGIATDMVYTWIIKAGTVESELLRAQATPSARANATTLTISDRFACDSEYPHIAM